MRKQVVLSQWGFVREFFVCLFVFGCKQDVPPFIVDYREHGSSLLSFEENSVSNVIISLVSNDYFIIRKSGCLFEQSHKILLVVLTSDESL